MATRTDTASRKTARAILPPWNGFVAAFVYYAVLSLAVFGDLAMPGAALAWAYLLPVAAFCVLLAMRGLRALAAIPVDLAETPRALLG